MSVQNRHFLCSSKDNFGQLILLKEYCLINSFSNKKKISFHSQHALQQKLKSTVRTIWIRKKKNENVWMQISSGLLLLAVVILAYDETSAVEITIYFARHTRRAKVYFFNTTTSVSVLKFILHKIRCFCSLWNKPLLKRIYVFASVNIWNTSNDLSSD